MTRLVCSGRTAAICVILALVGCSSKAERAPTFPVSGTITMEGKPVAGATIVFVPASSGAETAVGVSDAEGKYKLTTFSDGDGAQPGDYRIKVSKYDNKPPSAEESQRYVSLEEEAKTYTEDERPSPPSKNLLPPKYADESASGITHTVKDGPTTLDIKLE